MPPSCRGVVGPPRRRSRVVRVRVGLLIRLPGDWDVDPHHAGQPLQPNYCIQRIGCRQIPQCRVCMMVYSFGRLCCFFSLAGSSSEPVDGLGVVRVPFGTAANTQGVGGGLRNGKAERYQLPEACRRYADVVRQKPRTGGQVVLCFCNFDRSEEM
ncbi:hypothetical protein BGZ61DRAFT_216683 [Ilyonectria robusta]|uniref:uncharacterized protein n=1 Tax=Ilyonectria robusta TaxID=1079257 RepID=UPI001E8DA9A6|nr:uncharacterized protein BGZ61DRAFT_216683 [Ilyonectria robusta]KAH8652849.1 hypothetical protein BGZ61DRAFT_216683 [Ilyonectria robusta]